MSTSYFQSHKQRLLARINPGSQETRLATWITTNTRLGGLPFSYKDHEYQEFILSLNATHYCVKKPSQIGISEINARRVLGICNLNANIALAYISPTATASQVFAKTRIDIIINNSPEVRSQITSQTDSSSVKQFKNDSFLYFKGASRSSQAISTPLDSIVYDELDFFEDEEILTQFTSRLTHSKLDKNEFFISTPTTSGYGITALFDDSKQYIEMQRCCHCNHWFQPSYYDHVVLPGFNQPLSAVTFYTKALLTGFDLKTAYLQCPNPGCRRPVDQSIGYREWICVNPSSSSDMAGVAISPFACPVRVPCGDLIRTSMKYARVSDFYNFSLGLDYSDAESEITLEELQQSIVPHDDPTSPTAIPYSLANPPPYAVMGVDLGGLCAVHLGYPSPQGPLIVFHSEQVPLRHLQDRMAVLSVKCRVICTVMDGQPYTEVVRAVQNKDPNTWAALPTMSKTISLYEIRAREEDSDKAFYGVRTISYSRYGGLDQIVAMIRSKAILFEPAEELPTVFQHIRDMRRIKIKDMSGEDTYVWRKSAKGVDHYLFSLLYLFFAFCIKGLAGPAQMPLPLLSKIKTKGEI